MDIETQQSIKTLIGEITELCFEISAEGIAECFCQFFGHVKQIEIYACTPGTKYGDENRKRIINRRIYVDGIDSDSTQQLQEALNALQSLKTNKDIAA